MILIKRFCLNVVNVFVVELGLDCYGLKWIFWFPYWVWLHWEQFQPKESAKSWSKGIWRTGTQMMIWGKWHNLYTYQHYRLLIILIMNMIWMMIMAGTTSALQTTATSSFRPSKLGAMLKALPVTSLPKLLMTVERCWRAATSRTLSRGWRRSSLIILSR